MKTKVNFIRGLHGMGVVIMITCHKSRAIFDFGAPFEPLSQIYDGTVLIRNKKRIKDALLLNQAPMVDYIYSKESLDDINLKPAEDNPFTTAVFISHCHKDHMSEIDKIDPAIPVYLHHSGLKLKQTLETIQEESYFRKYSGFEYNQKITVGDIEVTPYFSDHTCIGSASFLIQTEDSTIIYSGDIRFHGLESARAWQTVKQMSQHKIDLLIVDSTTASASAFVYSENETGELNSPSKEILKGMITEQMIFDDVRKQLQNHQGIAVFNLYHRDIRMLENLIRIAKEHQRKALFEPSTAYIINELLNMSVNVMFPDNNLYYEFYKEVMKNNTVVSKEEVLNNPNGYFIQNTYRNILELTDYDGIKGIYFHLFGEPLLKGQKHYQIMKNVIARLKWDFFSYSNLFSFSHAYPSHLAYYIRKLKPKAVVAVHSRNPEALNPVNAKHYRPHENIDYYLIDGQLIEKIEE
ncbi:MAG TPA: MBL fold metallo-hydrolase [Erysipelotrichaceae bacterium]|nr:MBL fold metallo-hydrolase [Erysipelotrichaceae bacterium]